MDSLIKSGLGKARLVSFVVSVPPITVHIRYDIAGKILPKLQSDLGNKLHRDRIIPVHVKDRCFDHFRDVSAIHRRTRFSRQSREPDLVVHDYVHGSTGLIAGQLRQV